jgi:hypothetical protein
MNDPMVEQRISIVYRNVNDALREELGAFWRRYGAIADPAEMRRRADEVVCVARDASGKIAGVNSVYIGPLAGQPHYFYRQFMRPENRQLALSTRMVREAAAFLRARHFAGDPVKGMVLVAENPKLSRPGGRDLLRRLGWTHLGKESRGHDVWRLAF